MNEFTYPYNLSVETVELGRTSLAIERLASLDETIDSFFKEYERTGRAELFEGLCPYFGVPWPAGKVLAEILEGEGEKWRGQEVLELGCGLALPALVLAKQRALVTATDLHPDVPIFLERNRERNKISGPDFLFLDWRLSRSLPPASLVIGSDIVYDRAQPEQLVEFLKSFTSWREALFTDPGRPYWDRFVELVGQQGWRLEQNLISGIFVLRLLR